MTDINTTEPPVEKIQTITEEERKRAKRKAYKLRQKTKKNESKLIEEADGLQEQGKENLEKWEQICSMVDDYKKKFDKFPNMRSNGREVNDEAAKVLGRWLWLQTVSYKKGNMHSYHKRRLEEIGWKFQ